jgi:hypothetical protein
VPDGLDLVVQYFARGAEIRLGQVVQKIENHPQGVRVTTTAVSDNHLPQQNQKMQPSIKKHSHERTQALMRTHPKTWPTFANKTRQALT